jgi:hypothetical protein
VSTGPSSATSVPTISWPCHPQATSSQSILYHRRAGCVPGGRSILPPYRPAAPMRRSHTRWTRDARRPGYEQRRAEPERVIRRGRWAPSPRRYPPRLVDASDTRSQLAARDGSGAAGGITTAIVWIPLPTGSKPAADRQPTRRAIAPWHGKEQRALNADTRSREPRVRRPARVYGDCSIESAHGEERMKWASPFLRCGLRPLPGYSTARRNTRRRPSGSSRPCWD